MKNIIKKRFLSKIKKNSKGCWIWQGATYMNGYGHLRANAKYWSAHRFSYTLFKGEIPKGLVVMHTCDEKLCTNFRHLKAGTQQENVQDCIAKGRR